MTDTITLLGLEVFGHHGVFDFERTQGQIFVIDLTLGVDTRPAAASDDLRDTVDYGGIADAVRACVGSDPVDLIETLAERIAEVVLTNNRVEWVQVAVHKPNAPIDGVFADVVVTIKRSRQP